jgi:hypothetical protein
VTEVDWDEKADMVAAMNYMSGYCGCATLFNLVCLVAIMGPLGIAAGIFSILGNAICCLFFAKYWRDTVMRHYKMYPLVDQLKVATEKKTKELLQRLKID